MVVRYVWKYFNLSYLNRDQSETKTVNLTAPRRARPRPLKARTNRPCPKVNRPQQGKTHQPPSQYSSYLVVLSWTRYRSTQILVLCLLSNHRSSGKKTTPPTVKANTASGGKAPARSGSRVSARLSHIILPTNGNTKTSPGQSEPCKRPLTGKEVEDRTGKPPVSQGRYRCASVV